MIPKQTRRQFPQALGAGIALGAGGCANGLAQREKKTVSESSVLSYLKEYADLYRKDPKAAALE